MIVHVNAYNLDGYAVNHSSPIMEGMFSHISVWPIHVMTPVLQHNGAYVPTFEDF